MSSSRLDLRSPKQEDMMEPGDLLQTMLQMVESRCCKFPIMPPSAGVSRAVAKRGCAAGGTEMSINNVVNAAARFS